MRRSRARTPFFRFSHHLAKLAADILALGEHRVLLRFRDVPAGKRRRNPVLAFSLFPIRIRELAYKVRLIPALVPRLGNIRANRSEEHTSELQSPCNLV